MNQELDMKLVNQLTHEVDQPKTVRVGVGVFVVRDGKFLVQLRQGAHDADTWSLPGGHMEFGETTEQTARREVMEETSCEIDNVRFAAVTNNYFAEEGKHYVAWWVMADWAASELVNMEPEKCLEQRWVDFETLPEPLFPVWNELLGGQFGANIRAELAKSNKKGVL